MKRIEYAGSVHDEEEIEAVVAVLRGGATALRIGKNVKEMERLVAECFGKRRGVMVNSGSSALYLAVELLNLAPGDEIITSAVTFSTDIAPMVRSGLVPVLVDVTPDTYQIDVEQIESAIGPRTRALLVPNLIGNCPDWDVIRQIAKRHQLQVVEDSCDCLGATLRGTPTGTRADITVTSFALSHIITAAGSGGMLCLDDMALADRALLLRRWGRRSETAFFGSRKGERRFFSDLDGLEYDDLFIFDEVGWNFEPSELSAAFGCVQMRKLADNLARRQRNFALLSEVLGRRPEVFTLPRLTPGVETGWHMFPFLIRPESGVVRGAFQAHMEQAGVDTRMVWSGNVARQPAFADKPHRVAPGGLANADRVMECGLVLPCNHGIDDEGIRYVAEVIDGFFA
ncbi:MAG: aminotransferase class I/II-fold pyridoxal phosphate-dependent enzyme [Deltaproteobacteria bacterium]|nr:aminotransferase class I/II-fold pyridoxal phosphate-dependent enzyme [Deltaproteobacteria bacterium]MBW2359284.1 aminotransferase class I/II-fold pyridoxal phosphate-dependent enzyme [Deltaproteobacteria bacterium]